MDASLAAFALYHKVIQDVVSNMRLNSSVDEDVIEALERSWVDNLMKHELKGEQLNPNVSDSALSLRKKSWESAVYHVESRTDTPFLSPSHVYVNNKTKRDLVNVPSGESATSTTIDNFSAMNMATPTSNITPQAPSGGVVGGNTMPTIGIPNINTIGAPQRLPGMPGLIGRPNMMGTAPTMSGMTGLPMPGMAMPGMPMPGVNSMAGIPPLMNNPSLAPIGTPGMVKRTYDTINPISFDIDNKKAALLASDSSQTDKNLTDGTGAGADDTEADANKDIKTEHHDEEEDENCHITTAVISKKKEPFKYRVEKPDSSSTLESKWYCDKALKLIEQTPQELHINNWEDYDIVSSEDEELCTLSESCSGMHSGITLYDEVKCIKKSKDARVRWNVKFSYGIFRVGWEDILFHRADGKFQW